MPLLLAYRDAARFDDELAVALRVAYLGTTSLRFAFEIRRAGVALCDGAATYVNGERVMRRPCGLGEGLVAAIVAYERTAPARKAAVLF